MAAPKAPLTAQEKAKAPEEPKKEVLAGGGEMFDEEKPAPSCQDHDEHPPFVGAPVQYLYDNEPWAALITKVKADGLVDLAAHRPDGHDVRLYDVAPITSVRKNAGWRWAPEMF